MKIKVVVFFSLLVFTKTIVSVNQWSLVPLSNTSIDWLIDFTFIGFVVWYKYNYFKLNNTKDYRIVSIYLAWMLVGVIRGMFVAENYWEWKQWVTGTTTLTLPLLVYIFDNPLIISKALSFWLKYALPAFVIFIGWIITSDAYHFYLSPVLFLACFLPIIKRKWQIIFSALLLLMLFADFGARSQVIKASVTLFISGACFFSKHISTRVLKLAHWFFYILPVVLLFLGVLGIFNPFKDLASNEGKYVEKKVVNGKKIEDDLSADTRTFIYIEVLSSAIVHNYVLWGRTPARGNDSVSFGAHNAEELKTGKYERHSNEVCFPNVFTWLGVIGMLLYCSIYIKSSYLAVYKSNNIYLKLIGVLIAFHFTYGWIEDFNRFDIMNISFWLMIGIGFSKKFRAMSDTDFQLWMKSIFYKL